MTKKIPLPRKGEKTPPLNRGGHKHNDAGESTRRGGKLYTYCTCGHLMAVDDIEDE